ncbi:uncharacterized protein olf186-M isoform X2 [Prorops nasuta]
MRRRTGPVQQWVDSIPSPAKSTVTVQNAQQNNDLVSGPNISTSLRHEDISASGEMCTRMPSMTVSAPINVPNTPVATTGTPNSLPYNRLVRDTSFQSDSSHCSSVESLLELRKADPEAVLLGLGFGGCSSSPQESGPLSRIPKRFLQPSKLKGIAVNDFVKRQQEASESIDSVSLGYRGLTGSPYIAPSEIVQKIMERLREHESHEIDAYTPYNHHENCNPVQNGKMSVLSPDNRQFLEQPRSKSPDMRNKRMIIGQKSFAFGRNGDLIEISSTEDQSLDTSDSRPNNNDSNLSLDFEHVSQGPTELPNESSVKERLCQGNLEFSAEVTKTESECNESSENSLNYRQSSETVKYNQAENDSNKNDEMSPVLKEKQNILLKKQYAMSECDFTKRFIESRRASDGEPNIESISFLQQDRRFSDGTVEKSDKDALFRRRKSLKRQFRVNDMDDTDYVKLSDIRQRETSQVELENTIDMSNVKIEYPSTSKSLNNENAEGFMDQSKTNEDPYDTNSRCSSNVNLEINNEDKRSDNDDKLLKGKKNGDNILPRKKKERTQIRGILSSVLSVRMEPGF